MKNTVIITGQPILPIIVGKPAWIRERQLERQTTTVQRILEQKDRHILFETKNTVYRLMLEEVTHEQ